MPLSKGRSPLLPSRALLPFVVVIFVIHRVTEFCIVPDSGLGFEFTRSDSYRLAYYELDMYVRKRHTVARYQARNQRAFRAIFFSKIIRIVDRFARARVNISDGFFWLQLFLFRATGLSESAVEMAGRNQFQLINLAIGSFVPP